MDAVNAAVYLNDGNLPYKDVISKLDTVDEIINSWWLVGTPLPVAFALVYVSLVYFGKRWMTNRAAYQLFYFMRVYDLIQVALNVYQIFQFFSYPNAVTYMVVNSCVAQSDVPNDLLKTYFLFGWYYLMLKIVDLLDTIIMVLRKKNSHITLLHVYHHVGMVLLCWVTFRYAKAFQGAFLIFLNDIVHTVMYSYYFLATFPQIHPYLAWKKYLTKLQLIQFVMGLFYISNMYYNGCPVSNIFFYIWIVNISVILALFINFYYKSYASKTQKNGKHSNKLN